MDYNLIVCGGTFDHFHKGQESLLRLSLSLGNKVVIGVTSDKFVRSWKVDDRSWKQIEPFEDRKQSVLEFIKSEGSLGKAEIIEINDLFGPTLSRDLQIDGIVVSKETRGGADIINQERKKLGLAPLKIFIAPPVLAEDGKVISSAKIRNGEINRAGRLYVKPAWLKTDLALTENLRQELKKPLGEMVTDVESLFNNKNSLVVTVGDVTTKTFNEKSLGQNISAIDFKVARKKKFSNILELGFSGKEKIFKADNPAGYITHNLFLQIENIFKSGFDKKIILKIEGEEDLTVLPLILAAPLNTVVYYGQPNAGLVKVVVSAASKEIAYSLIERFEMLK